MIMHESLWSDDELRAYIAALRDGGFFSTPDEVDRERFIRQARHRLVPEVQQRLLAEVGAVTDPSGVARIAFEVLEEETWGKRHTWLMVTAEPWGFLVELVHRQIRAAYRSSVRKLKDEDKRLKGIAKASSRGELGPGRAE